MGVRAADESGAAGVIEMTLIFPVILICIFFLISAGCFMLQAVFTYNNAQRVAMAAVRMIACPGYGCLYGDNGITVTADFTTDSDISADLINRIMRIHSPYRYLTPEVLDHDDKRMLDDSLKRLVGSNVFFSRGSTECDITVSNRFVSQEVKVHVARKLELPAVVRFAGVSDSVEVNITASAFSSDQAEFIRNADMVIDLKEYLFSNLKIGSEGRTLNEKISAYRQKFSDMCARVGLEW